MRMVVRYPMGDNSTLFHSEFGGEWCLYFKRIPELLTAVSSLTGKKEESINCTRLRRVFYRSSRYPSFSSPWGKRYRMSGMSRSQLRKTETWGPWTLGCLLPGVDLSVGRTAALRGSTGQTEYLLMYLSSAHPEKMVTSPAIVWHLFWLYLFQTEDKKPSEWLAIEHLKWLLPALKF